MAEQIKLLLLIPHLGGGGAERVTSLLAQHLNPAKFEIHLVTLTPDRPGATQPLPHVQLHRLNLKRVRQAWLPLLRLIRTQRPDLILSNMAHLNFLILLLKPFLPRHARILVRQNTTASLSAPNTLTRYFYRHLYPCADAILCQTQAMADDLTISFRIAPSKLHILPNPIELPVIPATPPQPPAAPRLLTVGRLSHEKGLDLLLHALPAVLKHHPAAHLTILGAGPEESTLRHLTRALSLQNSITFAGHTDPSPFFFESTLYILPSRYEGLPNALLEAASAGLPIVATPCSPGLTQLLQGSAGTWITTGISPQSLTDTLIEALRLPPTRYQHDFLAPFQLPIAISQYETLLTRIHSRKIALIIPTIDHIGGAERQLLHLARELASRGWQVTVVALSGTGGPEAATLRSLNISFLSLEMRKAWLDPRGWLRFLRWARLHRPDILHAHLPHATWFARCIRPFARIGVLIDTIHTTSTGTNGRKLLYRITNPLTTHVTCVSHAVAESALAARMVSAAKLTLLPNGVPLPPLTARQSSPTFRWIAVGRLAPVKDYPTLLHAFATLPSHATLQIVGTGPEELTLRSLSASLNIADRVHFSGFHADIPPLLAQADAFVQSSLWEGLPISILEASASALPVVATDAAGTREALIPGQTGLIAPIGDSSALAATMAEVMALPHSERKKIGQHGRQFVEQNFSLSAITTQWEALYRRLLRRESPTAQTISSAAGPPRSSPSSAHERPGLPPIAPAPRLQPEAHPPK